MEGWVPGIFLGYDACDSSLISWLASRKTEPKEIHCCLISHQHVVFTLQLEILVTAQHMALGFRSKHRIGCTARPGGPYFETGLRVKIKRKKGNKYLPFVWKTWWFQGELKWDGSSWWKFSEEEVIPFEVLLFSRFYRKWLKFFVPFVCTHHLYWKPGNSGEN